jgi:hypothetical protein
MTDAEKRARAKYLAKGKRLTVNFYPTELDLYEHLANQPQKTTYIKDLIRADMKTAKQKKMKEHLKELSQMQAKIHQIAADKEVAAFTEEMKAEIKKREG